MEASIINILNAGNKTELNRFVKLERKLMKENPLYISDIDSDVTKLLNKKSPFFKQMELCLFVASKAGEDIARCAALINKKYQAEKEDGVGFIGFFAAARDCKMEVGEMFCHAEEWLKENGVTKIIAPCNGGSPQSMGFLTTAYDESPMFPFPWHPPYYKDYIESLNYNPAYPLWYYEIDFASEKYQKTKQRHLNNQSVNIRPISKKNWDSDLEIIRQLLNETFKDEWEFCNLTSEEMKEFFGAMKPIIDPHQMLIAEIDGRPAGFCIALPDLTPLFRSFKGSVGLIGIFKLLTKAKKYERAGIIAIGVISAYKGKGISKALAIKLYSRHEELGLKKSLYYPVNEKNMDSRGFAESIGGTGRVIYQVYEKTLS